MIKKGVIIIFLLVLFQIDSIKSSKCGTSEWVQQIESELIKPLIDQNDKNQYTQLLLLWDTFKNQDPVKLDKSNIPKYCEPSTNYVDPDLSCCTIDVDIKEFTNKLIKANLELFVPDDRVPTILAGNQQLSNIFYRCYDTDSQVSTDTNSQIGWFPLDEDDYPVVPKQIQPQDMLGSMYDNSQLPELLYFYNLNKQYHEQYSKINYAQLLRNLASVIRGSMCLLCMSPDSPKTQFWENDSPQFLNQTVQELLSNISTTYQVNYNLSQFYKNLTKFEIENTQIQFECPQFEVVLKDVENQLDKGCIDAYTCDIQATDYLTSLFNFYPIALIAQDVSIYNQTGTNQRFRRERRNLQFNKLATFTESSQSGLTNVYDDKFDLFQLKILGSNLSGLIANFTNLQFQLLYIDAKGIDFEKLKDVLSTVKQSVFILFIILGLIL